MIVITTPTGTIGHRVVEHLLRSAKPLRLIVRDPSRLAPEARKRGEVVQGSHGDIDVINRAFADAESVFWLVPPDPRAQSVDAAYVDFTRPACRCVQKASNQAGSRNLSPGARYAGGHERRSRGGVAQDGRPDREHGSSLPSRNQPFVHGQPAPTGRINQEQGVVLVAHFRRSQAAQRLHPRHRRDCGQAAAR